MKELHIAKAGQIGDRKVEPVTLFIDGDLPEFKTPDEERGHYDWMAASLTEALINSLPMAVLERVLIRLLQRKAGVYMGIMPK